MTSARPAAVVILAAGEGTRMKSATPKVLHRIGGRSLLGHAMAAARSTEPEHLVVVVRHERERVAAHIAELEPTAIVADQDEVKGTGRAVECGLDALPAGLSGTVVVTYGDVPLLSGETLHALVHEHNRSASGVTVVTAHLDDPTNYGRILRGADGSLIGIVEHKDATDEQRRIAEINSGIYAFDAGVLRAALAKITTNNAQGEKYLTDVLALAREAGAGVTAYGVEDRWQTEGVNDRVQLATLGRELNARQLERWMRAGVTIVDPATTWIDVEVTIGQDTVIQPGTQLLGATTIGADARIGPDTTLRDTAVGDRVVIRRTEAHLAIVEADAEVGPFAYLRPGTRVGVGGKIGGFVETKNADIGAGAKIPHLSYVGDAEIGEGTNIGASSVFVNYDGVHKSRTVVGKHCRMGSDTMYVAPVTVGDGAYSGAGTVIRKDVPPGSLAINVAPQRNLEGWVEQNRPGTPAAQAARAALEATQDNSHDDHQNETNATAAAPASGEGEQA